MTEIPMSEPTPVLIPLINPNEPEAQVAAVLVKEGQAVSKGDVMCTLETTKSAADLVAEAAGYVAGLRLNPGDTARAGEVMCYLSESSDWKPPISIPPIPSAEQVKASGAIPAGLRISQKALTLAQEQGLDLNLLPLDTFITEKLVQTAIEKSQTSKETFRPSLEFPQAAFDPTAILVYGGGGHGKSLIDLLRALRVFRIIGIIDDGIDPEKQSEIMGVPVLGNAQALPSLYAQGVRLAVNAVGGIGNIAIRIQVFERLAEAGFACPAVVHPSAVVEPSAVLSAGAQVFPLAYVGSQARLGYGAIINTGAIVSHDCQVGDYANLSPGAILAGEVQVGRAALVGMSATINLRTHIGKNARIGNGATIKSDVPDGGVVKAGTIWPQ
jgi:sugar O-acyltransferase (sialic acid O-acetyltransferase NeuD family)